MTTPDKLSREWLKYLALPFLTRGHTHSSAEDVRSMATEILELREEVERLRLPMENVRSIPWPPAEFSNLNPGPDGQIPQTTDPELVRLRLRVDEIEQSLRARHPIGSFTFCYAPTH